MKICTLIAIPSEVVLGSAYDTLSQRWPMAICHDGVNVIFNGHDSSEDTYLIADSVFSEIEGESDYIGRLVTLLAPMLYSEDRLQPIHIPKSTMSRLFRHSAYRLFCANYTVVEELMVDYNAVFGVAADESKGLEVLKVEAKALLEQLLG